MTTPPITGLITINGLALDTQGSQGIPVLSAPNPSDINQQWDFYPDTGVLQSLAFPNVNGGWVCLRNDTLTIDLAWENEQCYWQFSGANATGNMSPLGNPALCLVPNAAGTSVVLGPMPGWSWEAAAAAPPATPTGPTPSPYVPAGFTLVWNDEFTGVTMAGCPTLQVDITKWQPFYTFSGGTLNFLNAEEERYDTGSNGQPNHVITTAGLALTAYPANSAGTYQSGMIRSAVDLNLQSQATDFYIEAKIKTCGAQGAWPAFWLSGDGPNPQWPPEIDIAERNMPPGGSLTTDPAGGVNVVHMGPQVNNATANAIGGLGPWNDDPASWSTPLPANGFTWNAPSEQDFVGTPFDITAGFHIYALKVTRGVAGQQSVNPLTNLPTHLIQYYIDGQLCLQHEYDCGFWPDGTTCPGMSVLFDLAIGGQMGGTPNITAPVQETIAYIRVYQSALVNGGIDGVAASNTIAWPTVPATGY